MNQQEELPKWPFERVAPLAPPAEYDQLRNPGCPMNKVRLWSGEPAWLGTTHADVTAVLKNSSFSSNPRTPGVVPAPSEATYKYWLIKGTFDKLDPPEHTRERRMVQAEFMVKNVRQYEPFVNQLVDELLDDLERLPQPVDLIESLGHRLASRMTCHMMGLPADDADFLRDQLGIFMSQASSPEESHAAMQALLDYFDDVVLSKSAQGGDDIASRLVENYVTTGKLDREGARRILLDLLIGGFDTTTSMTAMGAVVLKENPEQLALLRDDPGLWPAAVDELLRYLTIAHFIGSRTATSDVQVNNTQVKAGDGVFASLLAANWDPDVFPNPGKFDITRGNLHKQVAFGHGVHTCLGQPLARLELEVTLRKFCERFPDFKLITTSDTLRFTASPLHTPTEVLVNVKEGA